MKKRLSSVLTFPYKLLVSFLGAYLVYLTIFKFSDMSFIGLILGYAGVLMLYLLIGTYKRVCIDEEWLYVSNYFREERIPLNSIQRVNGPSRWSSIPSIELTLDHQSGFGQTVRFSPPYFDASAIAEELRHRSSSYFSS